MHLFIHASLIRPMRKQIRLNLWLKYIHAQSWLHSWNQTACEQRGCGCHTPYIPTDKGHTPYFKGHTPSDKGHMLPSNSTPLSSKVTHPSAKGHTPISKGTHPSVKGYAPILKGNTSLCQRPHPTLKHTVLHTQTALKWKVYVWMYKEYFSRTEWFFTRKLYFSLVYFYTQNFYI